MKSIDICIIPARGGSKRIPFKNKRLFCGKPMIAWSIEAAFRSGCFDRIIVSTEDQSIASVAKDYGADVPFLRPAELADDHAGTREVVLHAVDILEAEGLTIDAVCCLYATAPFVRPEDLQASRNLLVESKAGTIVFPATSFSFPIQRSIRIDSAGYSSPISPSHVSMRSQDLEEAFHDAGQFYWATPSTWRSCSGIFEQGRPLLLPRWRVQDIDTEEDWKRAEFIHRLVLRELCDG